MQRIICLLGFMVFFVNIAFGQSWVGAGYDLNISIDEDDGTFDIIANADGIHVVYGLSNSIEYRQFSAQGSGQGSTVTIASLNETPKIFKIVEADGDIYVFYKDDNELLTKRSTNGGASFSSVASAISFAGSNNESNGIDAVVEGDDDKIHVVWSELPSNETWYQVLSLFPTPAWDGNTLKNVTDHASAQNGGFPSIALSPNRIHVGFSLNTINWPAPISPDNNYLYTRDKTTSWQAPETQTPLGIKNFIATTSDKLHLFYFKEVQYSPTEYDLDIFHTTRSFSGTTWSNPFEVGKVTFRSKGAAAVAANDILHLVVVHTISSPRSLGNYNYYEDDEWHAAQIIPGSNNDRDYKISPNGNDVYVVLGEFSLPTSLDLYLYHRDFDPLTPQNLTRSIAQPFVDNHPRIDWDANEEADIDEYEVWKKIGNGNWNLLATTANNYYIDESETGASLLPFTNSVAIYYKLKAVDLENNKSDYSDTVIFNVEGGTPDKISENGMAGDNTTPDQFALFQNYPNPFNPSTTITFSLKEAGAAELTVYNLNGQKIATLVNSALNAGVHRAEWNGRDQSGSPVSSGVYVYQLKSGEQRMLKKMLLIK